MPLVATKPNVLATLSDRNYLEYAKQLFSSVYFNAGWQGDYLLLAHEVDEADLTWFRDKGILVKHCRALHDAPISRLPATTVSRFYLFTEQFKQWNHIIYLDVDMTVCAELDHLTSRSGFYAVAEPYPLEKQFALDDSLTTPEAETLAHCYDLNNKSFNAAFFAFSSDLIKHDTFAELNHLFKQYHHLHQHNVGEQPTLNLKFHQQWRELPYFYSSHPEGLWQQFRLHFHEARKIAIHYSHLKPWDSTSKYYDFWQENFVRADEINLAIRQLPADKSSRQTRWLNWQYLKMRRAYVQTYEKWRG